MGTRGVRESPAREQAGLPFHRLLDMPLVPRHGAGVVRKRGDRGPAEPRLRAHQGGPRRAPRCGPDLHDVRPGHHGRRRLAHVGVAHARVAAILRRHLLSAGRALRASRLRVHPDADRRRLGRRPRPDRRFGARPGGATQETGQLRSVAGRGAGDRSRDTGQRLLRLPPHVRFATGRLWGCAQVPAARRAQLPATLLRRLEEPGSARYGASHAAGNGQGRDVRSARRRVPPLFGGRPMVRAALREDALRPGAARHLIPGGLPDHRRPAVRGHRAAHARLRSARHDGHGFLLGRRRR